MVETDIVLFNMRELRKALEDVPKDLQKEVRAELRPIGEEIKTAAARNASWSTRIPRSLSVRIRFGNRPSVTVLARRQVAPHARPLEGATGERSFRHPVFGNLDVWVAQPTRPYLLPAVREVRARVLRRMTFAVDRVLARHGLPTGTR